MTGWLHEIFASIQGEGLYCGQRHTFLRLAGCNLQCGYCDTAYARGEKPESCKVEIAPGTGEFQQLTNPLNVESVLTACDRLGSRTVALTGGEPLLQVDFLTKLMPALVDGGYFTYLETNGAEPDALERIVEFADVIAMDFKLPSSSGVECWDTHDEFLRAASRTEVFVKAIVSNSTTADEVRRCADIVSSVDPETALVLQPVGETGMNGRRLMELQDAALKVLEDVRVIPQCHKLLDLL